jgi:hypothetical protein
LQADQRQGGLARRLVGARQLVVERVQREKRHAIRGRREQGAEKSVRVVPAHHIGKVWIGKVWIGKVWHRPLLLASLSPGKPGTKS